MRYVGPQKALINAQMPVGIKLFGVDCLHYQKLISEQDKVYGIYGGETPVVTTTTIDTIPNVYGEYGSIPSPYSPGIVELPDFTDPTPEIIDISQDYSTPKQMRVLLTSYQWKIIDGVDEGYLEDAGYCYSLSTDELKPGDVLEIATESTEVFRLKIISPEAFGQDEHILTRFKISNLGG